MLLVLPVGAGAQTADEILSTARYVTTLQQQDLEGRIRKDGRTVPVGLFLRGENIQFQYFDAGKKAWDVFHMRLNENHYDLFEIRNGKTLRFPEKKLGQPIMGSDLSYEDLAFRFLYWPSGKIEGSEKIKGQDCWKIRLQNPGRGGDYALVYVWVHKKAGALMQVVGYNNQGRALKRFQVTDLMKIGDAYTVRRMRVDRIEPVANKVVGLTYLEFEKPKAAGPGGLR
ncbi:MAG: outer membrane lipoprotein-sorting protein [Akkermansiaceae bacterium]|nr:outer membrane lipoprotein-sorting protein [Akkermansiaceae bacterium]NNM28313.1 outer membrane lipoprotein-sorting protein [Akkermansiaceae bacterium]